MQVKNQLHAPGTYPYEIAPIAFESILLWSQILPGCCKEGKKSLLVPDPNGNLDRRLVNILRELVYVYCVATGQHENSRVSVLPECVGVSARFVIASPGADSGRRSLSASRWVCYGSALQRSARAPAPAIHRQHLATVAHCGYVLGTLAGIKLCTYMKCRWNFKWKIWHCYWFILVGYILHMQFQNKISRTSASYLTSCGKGQYWNKNKGTGLPFTAA